MLASLTKASTSSRIIPTSGFAIKRPVAPIAPATVPSPGPVTVPTKTDAERLCHFVDAPITYTDSGETKVTKNVRHSRKQEGGGSHVHEMKQGDEAGKKFALFYCVVKDCSRKWWLPHTDVPKVLAGADISTGEEGCATDEEEEEQEQEEEEEEKDKVEVEEKEAAKEEEEADDDDGEKEYEPPVEMEREKPGKEEKEAEEEAQEPAVSHMESASDDEEKEEKKEPEPVSKRKPGRPKKGEEKPRSTPPASSISERTTRAVETRKHPVYIQVTDQRCIEHPSFNHRKKDREEEIDRIRMSLQCLYYDEMQSWMKAEWKLPKYAACQTSKERVWRFREAVQDKINDFCRDKKSKKTMTTFDQHSSEFGDSSYDHDDRVEARVAMLYEVKRLNPDTMKFTDSVFQEDMDSRSKEEEAEEDEDEEMRKQAKKATAEDGDEGGEDDEEEEEDGEKSSSAGEETDEDSKVEAGSDAESSDEEEEDQEEEEEKKTKKPRGKKAAVGSKRKRSVKGKGKAKAKGKKKPGKPAKKKAKVGGRPNNASIRESFDQLRKSNEEVLAAVNTLVNAEPEPSKDEAFASIKAEIRELAKQVELNHVATTRAFAALSDDVHRLVAEPKKVTTPPAVSKTTSSSSSVAKAAPTKPVSTATKPVVGPMKQTLLVPAGKK